MDFINLINLNELEFKSDEENVPHYNINSSKIKSKDLGAKKLFLI